MPSSARRLDLSTLWTASVTEQGAVVPLPHLTAGTLTWPWQHAHSVLHEWRRWIDRSDGVVTSAARLLRAPGRRPIVAVELAVAGEPEVAGRRLEPLRRLEPEHDTVRLSSPAPLPPAVGLVPAGTQPITAHRRLRTLPAGAVDAFLAATGPASGSDLLAAELHHLGGTYALAAIGAAADPEEVERVRIGLDVLERRLAPWLAR